MCAWCDVTAERGRDKSTNASPRGRGLKKEVGRGGKGSPWLGESVGGRFAALSKAGEVREKSPPPVSLPSIGMFKWTVLISSSRSVPSPPGLEDKLAAECSFWPYVLNWRLGRLFYLFINRFCPEAGRNSFCILKRQYLSFWATRLRWNFKHCCQMRCGSKEKLKIMRFSPFLLSNMFKKEVKKNLFMSVFHVHQAPWHVDMWVMR